MGCMGAPTSLNHLAIVSGQCFQQRHENVEALPGSPHPPGEVPSPATVRAVHRLNRATQRLPVLPG